MAMTVSYSPTLVILSVAVAILASYVALNLAHSVTKAKGKAQIIWLSCGALAMGVGIWSMHFVGMLAFEMPGMEMAYDIPLMALSVIVAAAGSGLALFVVSRPTVPTASLVSGGIAMAAAISGMHYIGMFSMRMEARIEWNLYLVFLSVVIALIASYAALLISYRLRYNPERFSLMALASVIMGFAISGMHYVGMFAATFVHDSSEQIKESHLLVSSGLTLATLFTTLSILAIALLSSLAQRMMDSRTRQSEEKLGASEEKYRLLVKAVKEYAIFVLDPRGYITTWNSGAEKILGYKEEEIVGKHVSTFYTEGDVLSNITEGELKIASSDGHFEGEAVRVSRSGARFWANIVIDPLTDKDGNILGYSKIVRDITTIKEQAARAQNLNEELERRVQERTLALQERESQLRTITNAIPTLVAQVDKYEKFLFANNAFCEWFHRTPQGIRNLSFRQVLGEERYPHNKKFIDQVLKGETVSYERSSYSGTVQAILKITFVPEFDQADKVKGFIIVATDVTDYKNIENELKGAKDQAEVANQTKSAFLANMSHEIRTPLGAVIGFSELLLDEKMTKEERENAAEIIKRNGKLLSTIINDILDLSKVEAGKLEIENVEVDLELLLKEIIVLLTLDASGKGVELQLTSDKLVPRLIKTDPTRLRQILFNVIGNAIKFTERGRVSISVKLDQSDFSRLVFLVKDTGAGISHTQIPRLFSPFMQADVTTTRKFGGTGLGLALSKKLAQALGGDVRLLESEVNKGSTFLISIQHGLSEDVRISAEAPVDDAKVLKINSKKEIDSLASLKILVVDDSPDNLILIKTFLRFSKADVITAGSGEEGIRSAFENEVDLILMDLQMPGMDGYQATKELRKKQFKKPIIALTAHAMKEERNKCLDNGFDDHLTKPVDRDHLIQTLGEYSVRIRKDMGI